MHNNEEVPKYNLKLFYCLRLFLLVATTMATVLIGYKVVQKFNVHTHYHCQVINSNSYYLAFLTVAMATIVYYDHRP